MSRRPKVQKPPPPAETQITRVALREQFEQLLRLGPDKWTAANFVAPDLARVVAGLTCGEIYYFGRAVDIWRPVASPEEQPEDEWDEDAPSLMEIYRRGFENLHTQMHAASRWRTSTDPDFVEPYPFAELIVSHGEFPRGWRKRWVEAGGNASGKPIDHVRSSVWAKFNIYGHPYPPFDWGSEMFTESVALSAITPRRMAAALRKIAQEATGAAAPVPAQVVVQEAAEQPPPVEIQPPLVREPPIKLSRAHRFSVSNVPARPKVAAAPRSAWRRLLEFLGINR